MALPFGKNSIVGGTAKPSSSRTPRGGTILGVGILIFFWGALPMNFFQETEAFVDYWQESNITGLAEIPVGFLPESPNNEKRIEINLATQRMILFENGKEAARFVISSGRPDKATKAGSFSIISKYLMGYGAGDGEVWVMPYFMGIYKVGAAENGIHELPFINGRREGARSLGFPVSHGCVRLAIGFAQKVYNFADIGTPVIIYH